MERKGSKTLLWSVMMSAPGPLILGLGLLIGRSNTQLADLLRRSIELLAIIASFVTYHIIANKQLSPRQVKKLERYTNLFVGASMLLAGLIMLWITWFMPNDSQGNVLPGFIIALLGVTANSIFWFRYRKLSMAEHNAILAVQAKLYRAKTFVDFCVAFALAAVLLIPGSQTASVLDVSGSTLVSAYLSYSGMGVMLENRNHMME